MHLCTQAEHLIARGHYAAARRLLHRAQTLARASDHPEAEARALLVEAMAQSAANDFSGAIMLIQQAQRIGASATLVGQEGFRCCPCGQPVIYVALISGNPC
eukprot:1012816-Pelagomonas_calceolata.AAC.1